MILLGDCLERLKELEENSVDAVVTDPPYGLKFMGKKWDYDVPSVNLWREVFRVLKPGGHVLSFGGTRTFHRMACGIEDAGFEIRDQLQWLYGSGFPKSHNGDHGGTALKPANEPIVLARKPLSEKTVAANFLKWGVGGLNIDESRIGTTDSIASQTNQNIRNNAFKSDNSDRERDTTYEQNPQGRWPANVIFDEAAAEMLDGNDSGGASRFFYVAKASKKERNAGLEGMPERMGTQRMNASLERHEAGREPTPRAEQSKNQNHHPTVKPIKLMEYLCKLITPPGGLILDPFCGSGSTGVAAFRLGFKFIGIELDQQYAEIAEKRIKAIQP